MQTSTEFAFDPNVAFTPLLQTAMMQVMTLDAEFTSFQQVSNINPTRDICAMISLTGPVSVMLLFVFDHALAWQFMQREIEGLDIAETEDVMEAVLGEMANVVGGNATATLAIPEKEIHLSLPLIMRAVKLKPGLAEVLIQRTTLALPHGMVDFYCISPAILGSLVAS
jgi:CheY-specific phosphatase CheX